MYAATKRYGDQTTTVSGTHIMRWRGKVAVVTAASAGVSYETTKPLARPSSGSRGVSEVSTETPFCCDCIIAHISRTRAADLLSISC